MTTNITTTNTTKKELLKQIKKFDLENDIDNDCLDWLEIIRVMKGKEPEKYFDHLFNLYEVKLQ